MPETCPNCGALVPERAKACPECGADEETGWSEDATAQRLGVVGEEFDHEDFVRSEFGSSEDRIKPRGIGWFWWVVAILLLLLLGYAFLR